MLNPLKFYLFLCCIWSTPIDLKAQGDDQPHLKDLEEVSEIYVENLKPYLKKFSNALSPPKLVGDKREGFVKSQYQLFLAKTEFVQKKAIEELLKMSAPKNTNETQWIISAYAQVFMVEFPGLDYQYFEKCKDEANTLMEKRHPSKK
jgi:hypothetical protein